MEFRGIVGDYLRNLTDQWLLVAPRSNPGMLEMFRDRDANPTRRLVPWAGEYAGKYLTGAVEILRVTGDSRLERWLSGFVREFVGLQDSSGYLGPWPRKSRLTNQDSLGRPVWDAWGHYHSMLGLLHWHALTGDEAALTCAERIGNLLCRRFLGRKHPRLVDTGSSEMNLAPVHALCLLHRRVGKPRYLRLALQLVEEFAAMAGDEYLAGDYLNQALGGTEFFRTPKPRWESLYCILALAELHEITGDLRYSNAFQQIWWSIVRHDRHNNGGFSSGEQATGNAFDFGPIETCCTVAWTALSVAMLKLTGRSIVADELELTLLNSVTGMHSPTGRWVTYDTPMSGVRRASAHALVFQSSEGLPELNCCSANAPRGFGLLGEWALLAGKDRLFLNFYGPSELTARIRCNLVVELVQETDYPLDRTVRIRVTPSRTARFALNLRIPHWSLKTTVRLNGKPIRRISPAGYLTIERVWRRHDRVELDFDMSLRFLRGERECEGLTSIFRGPLLLAYDLRYNQDRVPKGPPTVRDVANWNPATTMMKLPRIEAADLSLKRVEWPGWMPPLLLLEHRAPGDKSIRLCDFGSAGEAGTPYASWLPLRRAPEKPEFSESNPMRTARVQTQ